MPPTALEIAQEFEGPLAQDCAAQHGANGSAWPIRSREQRARRLAFLIHSQMSQASLLWIMPRNRTTSSPCCRALKELSYQHSRLSFDTIDRPTCPYCGERAYLTRRTPHPDHDLRPASRQSPRSAAPCRARLVKPTPARRSMHCSSDARLSTSRLCFDASH